PRAALGRWWQLEFFPLRGDRGLLCVLGKITPLAHEARADATPLPASLIALRERHIHWHGLEQLPDALPALRRLAAQVRLAGQTRAPVLLEGEAGAGKRWLAQAIHYHGPAREQAFVALDCTS